MPKRISPSLRRWLFLLLALGLIAGFSIFSFSVPTHAATYAYSWPLIGQGSTGEDVYSVQLMLQARGYTLSIDGIDGPQTTGTVVSFQSANGLQADGVVGPQPSRPRRSNSCGPFTYVPLSYPGEREIVTAK